MVTGLWRFVALASLAAAASACNAMEVTGPTSLADTTARIVNRGGFAGPDLFAVQPAFVAPRRIAQPFCPSVPPFAADFTLLVRGDQTLDTRLHSVRMTFVDRSGIHAPAIVLPQLALRSRFGPLAIPAGGTRRFPLTATFGCATDRLGSVHVFIFTATRAGHLRSGSVMVPVS